MFVVSFTLCANVPLPMFEATLTSNRQQIERVADRVKSYKRRKVTMLGISFKEATDDLRESPLVRLAELLLGQGYDLRIYDPNVRYAALYGSNKAFIDQELPHLKSVLVEADAALQHGEVVILGHNAKVYRDLLPRLTAEQRVLDLADVGAGTGFAGGYDGLYW